MPRSIRDGLLAWAAILAPVPAAAQAIASDDPPPVGATPSPAEAAAGEATEEDEPIVVRGTRSNRRVEDEPIRVEVINREEIEEKILMRPGNVAMILSETGGLRVQVTSPALGAANIRVQGMEGRFTQLLADGLPLYGGQASSLGLLQIPPTDLGQVEVIKGAASALYGPSALGGMINLVSRRPGDAPQAEALLNATSRNGQDATLYAAAPLSADWGASLTGGYHRQQRHDLDADGWIDMPGYERWTARPRLFWEDDAGASLFATAGVMTERRRGGNLPGRTVPDGTPFSQNQDTNRIDAGLVGEAPLGEGLTAHVRASAMRQEHTHVFGRLVEEDAHHTLFVEGSLAGRLDDTAWVAGAAYQIDGFRSDIFPAFDYTYQVPGIFGQIEHEVTPEVTLAGSARVDFHNEYGTQASPRLSLLWRPGAWTIRLSGGRGFFAPTPFVDEIEAAGLARLEPLGDLAPETATTGALDIGYDEGPLEANVTLFASDLENAVELMATGPASVRLRNIAGTRRIRGAELLLRRRFGDFVATGSYVFVDATEPDPAAAGRRRVPLTPRHTAGLVAMWEQHERGRVGVELYYTGEQVLEDDPYRTRSRPYFELGMLAEWALGPAARVFLNAENILGTRQTRWDPLLRPTRAPNGRWTVDAWAPLEGFVLNGGIRLRFGED
jgi:iron complex outermembrane receptor protein